MVYDLSSSGVWVMMCWVCGSTNMKVESGGEDIDVLTCYTCGHERRVLVRQAKEVDNDSQGSNDDS